MSTHVRGAHASCVLVTASRRTNFAVVQRTIVSARRKKKVRDREDALDQHATRVRSPIIATMLCVTPYAGAATLQERIDATAPNETIRVESGVHAGPIIIKKPLMLIGEAGAEIRGKGTGKVVTIAANDVTLRGLRITGSGLQLSDDDAAIFVTGNRARKLTTAPSPIHSTAFT